MAKLNRNKSIVFTTELFSSFQPNLLHSEAPTKQDLKKIQTSSMNAEITAESSHSLRRDTVVMIGRNELVASQPISVAHASKLNPSPSNAIISYNQARNTFLEFKEKTKSTSKASNASNISTFRLAHQNTLESKADVVTTPLNGSRKSLNMSANSTRRLQNSDSTAEKRKWYKYYEYLLVERGYVLIYVRKKRVNIVFFSSFFILEKH